MKPIPLNVVHICIYIKYIWILSVYPADSTTKKQIPSNITLRFSANPNRATIAATERHYRWQSHRRRRAPVQSHTALIAASTTRLNRTKPHENGRQDHRYSVRCGDSVGDHWRPVRCERDHFSGDHAMPQQEVSGTQSLSENNILNGACARICRKNNDEFDTHEMSRL